VETCSSIFPRSNVPASVLSMRGKRSNMRLSVIASRHQTGFMSTRHSNREVRANFAELARQWRDLARQHQNLGNPPPQSNSPTSLSQLIRRTPLQWVIVALVQALDVVAIEALVTDLHPGTQRAHGRKFLDSEPDRLRCGRKAAIAQRLSCPALALTHEQLGAD